MWPFSSQEEVPQLSYEFDGQYLSWTQKTGTFLCVDLSAVNSISCVDDAAYIYLDGREQLTPLPLYLLRSHWMDARKPAPIARQF